MSKPRAEHECQGCHEMFHRPVWHCLACDHHYAYPEDEECRNCHRSRVERLGVRSKPITSTGDAKP